MTEIKKINKMRKRIKNKKKRMMNHHNGPKRYRTILKVYKDMQTHQIVQGINRHQLRIEPSR